MPLPSWESTLVVILREEADLLTLRGESIDDESLNFLLAVGPEEAAAAAVAAEDKEPWGKEAEAISSSVLLKLLLLPTLE